LGQRSNTSWFRKYLVSLRRKKGAAAVWYTQLICLSWS
jgi:hypothetical protein